MSASRIPFISSGVGMAESGIEDPFEIDLNLVGLYHQEDFDIPEPDWLHSSNHAKPDQL